ncbi:ribosome biogenesis GTPase YqeH [Vulcanibacillus modesticaldus]|uniref:Ribosome biogenesis GTPase YqeH n=1 Tax=Vulcanibacillus modesticaldus TaxID=337097 RepID=A0A1D2YTI3_9BACI|nr:ribosome biogenesis GTPase YqeH [Vulcanibacillus modesticaldus]OEF99012.1 ribosome biogenesis GTPase YqeH [Vulcanibacillus modesticaldus]
MNEIKYCEGCGVELQTEFPKKIGYIPPSALDKEQHICQRCFRIKHYNEVIPIEMDEDDFLQILNNISMSDSIVIHLVDLFDIDGTFITGLHRFIGDNPFIMVANKIDLFPKSTNKIKVKQWLANYAKEHGLFPEEIFLISAEKNIGLMDVAQYIEANRKGKDVLVVGATNVGKSTFINRLIPIIHQDTEIELTTSRYPGTTLNIVRIPLSDGNYIIDTPGVIHKERLSEWVSPETLKAISPRKTIKPKVYQLIGEQSLFWGGLARIDQVRKTRNSFVCYLSNDIPIHRTRINKADEIYDKHLGELLSPPSKEEAELLPRFQKHSFKISGKGKTDVVISGLGWVTIDGEVTNVDVYVPKGIGVHVRKALI